MTALHCYGFVAADAPPPEVEGVGEPAAPVELVAHGQVAALTSPVAPDRPLRARDARAHARVIDAAHAQGAVLPARFPSVVDGPAALTTDVLAPLEPRLAHALAEVSGAAQVSVRASYAEDRVLAELVRDDAEVARLHARTAGADPMAVHGERIRLGERVAARLERRRRVDAPRVREALGTVADRLVVSDPGRAYGIVDVDALVPRAGLDELDERLEQAAADLDEAIHLEVVGPTAPYAFADLREWSG